MKRLIWLVVLELLGFLVAASAQTVSPVVSEFNKAHGKGTVTATNNAIIPQVVTVRPYSTGPDGLRELDSTVHIRLSESSAKVPPRTAHSFDYDIICDKAPCAVAFVTTFTGQRVTEAIKLDFKILSTAYVCTDRKKDCRKHVIHDVWGLPQPAGQLK